MKKSRTLNTLLVSGLGALALLAFAGCGSKSTANVVSITVSPATTTVIVSQSVTLTATVSGTTNTNIQSWTCGYETTSVDSKGTSTTTKLQTPCTSTGANATGNIPANSTSTTVTFSAPNTLPDPTKLAGNNCSSSSVSCTLSVIITATAAADTKKTGTSTITIDSGIVVALTPATATVPTKEQQLFAVNLTNDLQVQGVNWLVTQDTTSTIPFPSKPTCSTLTPPCGTITSTGPDTATYTAPSSVPTNATLAVVATSKTDPTRFATGTITVIQGGPITFFGISPTIAPQGALFYDIYLDAPFISSASVINLTDPNNGKTTITSASNQFKVLFGIPAASTCTTTPIPSGCVSTGARLRLNEQILQSAGTWSVSLSDPAVPVTTCAGNPLPSGCSSAGAFTFNVVPVRPTSVASIPDSFFKGGINEQDVAIDGGYFGSQGQMANVMFNGNSVPADRSRSTSRTAISHFDSSAINAAQPGLYPVQVTRTFPPLPPSNNPSVTNIAVFPDYSQTGSPPQLVGGISAGTNPSAVDVDTKLGILAVAESGSGQVEFFSIGSGSLTSLGKQTVSTSSGTVGVPTGLFINQDLHTVAVVDYQNQQVEVFPLPGQTGDPNVTYPLRINLAGLLPAQPNPTDPTMTIPPARPYSIGVDPDTNMGIVAYSSTATPTTAKVGFLLDFNANTTQQCLGTTVGSPCVFAQVTLNTGPYPQIAMVPHSHMAYVTPGGIGALSGIDVTRASSQLSIASVSLISGTVTVTVTVPSGQTLGLCPANPSSPCLNPGNPGTVLIQNVPKGSSGVDFNGVFSVSSVLNNNSFTYAINSSANDSVTCTTSNNCLVAFSAPNVLVGISPTTQGIAVNPITGTLATADANATTAGQINLLNVLNQQTTSISFRSGCTAFTSICNQAEELLGTTAVAFQPYSNLLVSYNPNPTQNPNQRDQVSISNPVTQRRHAFACNPSATTPAQPCLTNPTTSADQNTFLGCSTCTPPSTGQINFPGSGAASISVNGTTLNLFGGLAVDPVTNQAFVVQSGASDILLVNLAPTPGNTLKTAEITELQVPTVSGATIGGIAGASMPQGTLTSTNDLAGVQIFGAGFDSNTRVVLDNTTAAGPGGSGAISVDPSGRRLTFTVPAAFLATPHRYAVTAINGSGVTSNATDFFVIKAVDLTGACSGGNPAPNSVAIADQLPGQGFSPIAVVTNSGCGNISIIDINPASMTFGTPVGAKTIAAGTDPLGVAVSQRYGLAVVANNTDGTASILDLIAGTQKVAAVTVGSTPTGVAIDDGTGTALVTNTGSNTVSEINLALLFPTPGTTQTAATSLTATSIGVDQTPLAVAIDPDRGSNNRGLAVVTALQLVSGGAASGVLDAIDIGGTVPAKSTSATVGSVTATPTGVVVDPSPAALASPSAVLFYTVSSGGNLVGAYNPDNGSVSTVHVGINPTSLALNPQTGGILTVNTTGHTVSIIDTLSNPFLTRRSYGLNGSAQFCVAIDQFTNLAVIADQASNRLLIFPMPN